MNKPKRVLFSIFIGVVLSGCAANAPSGDCRLIYSEEMRDTLVLPLIKKAVGEEAYKFYDYEAPTILYKGKEVWLLMGPTKSINGYSLTSEDIFVIVLEKCTNKYIDKFTQKMD
jgi:hypothetical protein